MFVHMYVKKVGEFFRVFLRISSSHWDNGQIPTYLSLLHILKTCTQLLVLCLILFFGM
jgi:hypothetical protein